MVWPCNRFCADLYISDKVDSPSKPIVKPEKRSVINAPSEEIALDGIIDIYEKDENAKSLIKSAITKNDFLNNMMDEQRLEAVTMAMYPQEFNSDEFIIREGEMGEHLYVSADGIFDVIKNNNVFSSFGPGVVFGEIGILYKANRLASIRVQTSAKVWIIQRTVFRRIMTTLGRAERNENLTFLKSVDALTELSDEKLTQVADLLKRQLYPEGTHIVEQGDEGDMFYIIRAGTVQVHIRDDDGLQRIVNSLKRGDCFGERALLHRDKRVATVIADPPGTECLTLDRVSFEQYLGTLEEIKKLSVNRPSFVNPVQPQNNSKYSKIKFSDLRDIGTLGVGSYGRVQLVENMQTKERFALKYLKKHEIVEMKHQNHVMNEKKIMEKCDSPFIVKLYRTYKDSKYVTFLMEPCLGGDLWTELNRNKQFDENTARFVIACVIEALGYMHERNMIYRDLKPENLMIDDKGYIKLVDLGFARQLKPPEKTLTFVGTPEYIAPEIIKGNGYDRSVDYWAIGILTHELLCGRPAFRGKDHMKTYHMILRGIDSIVIPNKIQRLAQDLIKNLCRTNPTERLGYAKNGVKDIKEHGWFKGFNWDKLSDRSMKAPRLLRQPPLNTTYPHDGETPPDETSGWDKDF